MNTWKRIFQNLLRAFLMTAVGAGNYCLHAATANDDSFNAQISSARIFHDKIIPVGATPSTQAESENLWQACENLSTNRTSGIEMFENFVAQNPNSPWTPSVLEGLAYNYRSRGQY